MDIVNMHKIFGKDHTYGSGDISADRQTHRQTQDTQTDILITTLRNCCHGQSNITECLTLTVIVADRDESFIDFCLLCVIELTK